MALNIVPLIGSEYGEAALQVDGSLGAGSMVLLAAFNVANAASRAAKKFDNACSFGAYGDLTTSSRYTIVDKVVKEHPNIQMVVGDSLGGSVAL